MKYKGKAVKGSNQEIIPIPRPDGDIVFIATAVKNWSKFDKLVPEPVPPQIIRPGGVKTEDRNDPQYKKLLQKWAEEKSNYLIIYSLKDSPDVEWETIDLEKSETWANWKKELEEAGFTEIEVSRVMVGVMRANSLDEKMIDEARANFLLGQQGSENLTQLQGGLCYI